MNLYTRAAAAVLAALALSSCNKAPDAAADKLTVGFAQIGSESGWRAAETNIAKDEAAKRGIDLKVADGQQQQQNQIKAVRAFIAQGVDAIFIAPIVETGWDQVLGEAKAAKIPVFLLDRKVSADSSLYMSSVAADSVGEGKVAGEWLIKTVAGKPCRVVELQGTVGASVANDRKKGFEEAIKAASNISLVDSKTGEFTRSKAKEVMESMIKAQGANKICAVYAHNDDMMIGAIQALKEAGLKPGSDVLTISIDGVPDIFKAMVDGEANATVELTPNMAGPAFDMLAAYKKTGAEPQKSVTTVSALYTPETAAAEYEKRKTLY